MAILDFENFKYFYVTKNNKGLTLFYLIHLFLNKCKNLSKQNAMHAMLQTPHLF